MMNKQKHSPGRLTGFVWNILGKKMRTKLIIIFLSINILPLILLIAISWQQFMMLAGTLTGIATDDASAALNDIATENIERMTTDAAKAVADFLYTRDSDILFLASLNPSQENYTRFIESRQGRLVEKSEWALSPGGDSWISLGRPAEGRDGNISSNTENNDRGGFHYRPPSELSYRNISLYDEATFIDLNGREIIKVTAGDSPKKHYPLSPEAKNIALRENTYIKAEDYFAKLASLGPGEIYVSDVIGAYVGTNSIGMYVPEAVRKAAETRGYAIEYSPEAQAYAGKENPNGQRFEGIVRWATPVYNQAGIKTGYASFALNHDHIMEFVDHITPMMERYIETPSAYEGNYAFIWDYKCRSICHPRHHSIVGYDPETGDPQIPWLESSIYNAWQESGVEKWSDFTADWPVFDNQSRRKTPAPILTRRGLVGLDGRYLNNAPQCTGWMDLSEDGGSGSFFILWSGLYKLTTIAAIPYYTGQYSPEVQGNERGFGFVTIGAGLEDFTEPATEIGKQLHVAIRGSLYNTIVKSVIFFFIIVIMVIFIAVKFASFLTNNITNLVNGVARFRAGERQFRFNAPVKDEFGVLADAFDAMASNIENSEIGPLSIIDAEKNVIYVNNMGLVLCNKTLVESIGLSYSEVSIYPTGSKYCPITALENGTESEALFNDVSKRYYKGIAHYFYSNTGKKIGYIISSADVTEIEIAREAADKASKAKGDFLSNMSHEIRTPLNAIFGMTTIATATDDTERKDYCLKKISEASKHLLGVINDILDISKIEANKLELSPIKYNFERMIQRVIDVIVFRIDEKSQHLDIHIDKNIPMMIINDEQRLAQVITNILSNAVKFTPNEGSIRLDAKLVSIEDNICTIRIDITDTGIGISQEQIPRMFNVFEQAEHSTSRKYGGTGLGLAISKSIVEMMGGAIWIESEEGKGSVFSLTVKAICGEEGHDSLLSPDVVPENLRILAVDDEEYVREYFRDMGEQLKIRCDVAESGQEAIEMIQKDGPYDMYFVDWKMPEMGGIELSRWIKKDSAHQQVIVMISSIEWIVIEAAAKEAGVDRYLQKPLFVNSIVDCINEYVKTSGSMEGTNEVETFEHNYILLVEDVEINREIVIALLEPTMLKIDCAENGAQAVQVFCENPERYDMIFMDLQMPEVDGLEATRRIRALDIPRAKKVPIIAMTANVFQEDVDNCLAAGMNGHIGKPIDQNDVFEQLRKYLPKTV